MKLNQQEIEEWKTRVQEAKAKGWKYKQFTEKYKIGGGRWQNIKELIGDPELTTWGRNAPKTKVTRRKTNYHAVAIPEIIEERKSNSQPVFCLVVAFDSKEAAFAAMGRI